MPRDFLEGLPPPPASSFPVVPFQAPKPQAKREVDAAPRRVDPKFHARMLPAHGSAAREVREALAGRGVMPVVAHPMMAAGPAAPVAPGPSELGAWWEEPVTLGALLLFIPPIGLTALWSSRRYTNDARWALTVMTALMMILLATVTIAFVTLRVV